MFDIGTISTLLLLAMLGLLAIGMPLGFASAVLAVGVLVMKFGPDLLFANFGTGPLNILAQRIYGLLTDYVLISIPLFIFMAIASLGLLNVIIGVFFNILILVKFSC